jgi:UTP--glucose-1-phosphate uridylyltransferase
MPEPMEPPSNAALRGGAQPSTRGHVDPARPDQDFVALAEAKMQAAGIHPIEIASFRRRARHLTEAGVGLIHGADLEALSDVPARDGLPVPDDGDVREILDQLVVIKLNGGLGTSMGLTGPKSLLPVKQGKNFLDIITLQVASLRERYGTRLPFLLMNSLITRQESLDHMARSGLARDPYLPADFLQSVEPKLREDDLMPVEWPDNPDLEWCPPGHGDIYSALAASGLTDILLDHGIRWCFVSNADNLGALPDVRIATWVARSNIPFAMEVVRGTPMDRKGGHLARRDGRIVLRESAQVPDGDTSFGDVARWKYFNTNSVWFDLRAVQQLQQEDPGAPDLPLIVNRKTVDPANPSSTPVLQLETAMGAAIGALEGAQVVETPRDRFVPVKTTDDLLLVRSDAYDLLDDGTLVPRFQGAAPVISLSQEHFGLVTDLDERVPSVPSLRECAALHVEGDVRFGDGVVVRGDVKLVGPKSIPTGTVLG